MAPPSLEQEIIESTFGDILRAISQGRTSDARALVPRMREALDRMDAGALDETTDWLSEQLARIDDPDLFDKTLEFMVEHDLAESEAG